MIAKEVTARPPRIVKAWSQTSQWFSVGLKEGTGPQDVIPGVKDWGVPRRVTRTGRWLGLDESFKVFASVSVAGGKLGKV